MPFCLTIGSPGGTAKRRPPYFKTKKLGLLGSTKALEFAPWTDPSWTLAAHPCCRPQCKREPDWYFDLHRPECFRTEKKKWNKQYHTWLKNLQTPIFMQQEWPEIPMSVAYPLDRILGEYRRYFTNHCAYMIALAMTEGVTHIGLFGCQYSHESEHGVQRDSLTYWLGRFEQYGGTVVLPPTYNSLLCRPAQLYGYESHDAEGKLIPAYRAPIAITKAKADGTKELKKLFPVENGKCEVPLMPHPEGEPIRELVFA